MLLTLLCLLPVQANAQAVPAGIAVGGDNLTRLVWNNPDSTISLWKIDGNGAVASQNSYGPYPGWSAAAVSMGPDNFARVLCTHPADGAMSLWRVDPSSPASFNPTNYGPYSGYTAFSVGVGGNNAPRILWNHTADNQLSLWNITPDTNFTYANYGPYADYRAFLIAVGPNSIPRTLWNKTDGSISLWYSTADAADYAHSEYGPYAGYSPVALAVDSTNAPRVLWNHPSDGTVSLWKVATDGTFAYQNYTDPAGYTPVALAAGTGGDVRLLWSNGQGGAIVWTIQSSGSYAQTYPRPYPTASSITISPSTITAGNTATATVYLSGPAPIGTVVTPTSFNSSIVHVPYSVSVATNSSSVSFPVTTSPSTSDYTSVLVCATVDQNVANTPNTTVTVYTPGGTPTGGGGTGGGGTGTGGGGTGGGGTGTGTGGGGTGTGGGGTGTGTGGSGGSGGGASYGHYEVTYTGGTISTQDASGAHTASPTSSSYGYDGSARVQGNSGSSNATYISAKIQGPITATLHWITDPAYPNSPLPAQAIVTETCNFNWQLYDPDSGISGSYNTDLGQTGPIAANTNSSGGGSKTFSVSTGGNSSFNVTFNPVGSFAGYLKYGCSYETLTSHFVVSANASNIRLSVPSPDGHPEAGDGSNQFVYDNIVPGISPNDKGHLFLDSIVSAPVADLNSLVTPTPQIDAVFDTALTAASGQPAGHTWVVGSDNLTVQTTHSTDSRVGTTHNQFVFFGLPANNSGFGNHQETLNYQGNPVSKANIQTFFLSKASNYPGAAADYNASSAYPALRYWTPNWYHYYRQLYPTSTSGYTVAYDGNMSAGGLTQATSPFNIYLGATAYSYLILRVFALDETNPSDLTTKIKYIGFLELKGLAAYIYVCEHERGHQKAFQLSVPPATNPIQTIATSPTVWPTTSDGDNVVDAWEDSHHLDSRIPDTTRACGPTDASGRLSNKDIPDNEVIAEIPALGGLFNALALWKQDWAAGGKLYDGTTYCYGGLQWGIPPPSPNLRLTFHPVASDGPINSAYEWAYEPTYTVSAVSEIRVPAIYPNASGMVVLTALP